MLTSLNVWRDVARCGAVWRGVARCGAVWRGVARCMVAVVVHGGGGGV